MVQKRERLFILEQDDMPPQSNSEESAAVIIYLYYLDTVKNYISYIEAVPKEYDIYIVSSNEAVLKKVQGFLKEREAVYILKKGGEITMINLVSGEHKVINRV